MKTVDEMERGTFITFLRVLESMMTKGPWELDEMDPFRMNDSGRGNMLFKAMSNEPSFPEMMGNSAGVVGLRNALPRIIRELESLEDLMRVYAASFDLRISETTEARTGELRRLENVDGAEEVS